MFKIFYDGYDENAPSRANARFYSGVSVYQFMPRAWKIFHVLKDVAAPVQEMSTPGLSNAVNFVSQSLWGTNQIDTDSAAYQDADNVTMVAGMVLPSPAGKGKALGVLSKPRLINRGLQIAERWLGRGYTQIAPGVFRSANGLRKFRMTDADILGKHGKIGPHFNFETFNKAGEPLKNFHMPIR